MIEFPAYTLQPKDEFTSDNGVTWHTVNVVRTRLLRVIIIDTTGHEVILKEDQVVILK